ncbi:MAG: 4-hydroxythreonine-4-phosphate dehydrogenase PdxA [Parvibaculum sp.]
MPSERIYAVTMGDPAGIGGDIALAAWVQRTLVKLPCFFLLDDPDRLARLSKMLALDVPIVEISEPQEAPKYFEKALPVLPCNLQQSAIPGKLDARNAPAVLRSLEKAVAMAISGQVSGVVTNPIHKKTLYGAGFAHPGHTEYLAEVTGRTPVMMLSCPGLRVVPVTIHIPVSAVAVKLNRDTIVSLGQILAASLTQDFGIASPRIGVAALNPHGGEGGALGREELDIIAPAVDILRDQVIDAKGPYPADTLFHAEARTRYDAVLCMYHDQALIPLKTIDFDNGVNTTLGLPIVRTSPDHGTALDIAGTGMANPASFIAALKQADLIAKNRTRNLAAT